MKKPELRKDYFKDEYVIIAPNHKNRPQSFVNAPFSEADRECRFCPKNFTNKEITYRYNNDDGDWEILASVNAFPAVSLDNPKSFGQAEVIIETRRHGLDINDFSVEHIVRVFDAYINRYDYLKKIDGIKHVIIFKNEGGKAGASMTHSHSQVIALPILPPKVESEIDSYNKYRIENNGCPYCDIIAEESDGPRVIWQDENLFVLAPFASASPYGAWFIPKRHVGEISDLNHGEKESIAKAIKIVLGKLDELGIAYNYFVENAINGNDYHMHIKLAPRPNIWAGLELGTGVVINGVAPEEAAKIYRGENSTGKNERF